MAWFATAQYLRYGLPIIALVCALGGAAYATARQRTERGRSQAALHVVLAVVALAYVFARAQFPDIAHRYAAFGLESREAFLDEHLAQQGAGSYALMRLLDSDPTVTRVLALHDGAMLYTRAQISGIFTSGGDFASAADDATVSAKLRAPMATRTSCSIVAPGRADSSVGIA
ncbi:MAG: hypothetical protein U0232_08160 [Thermomicrobiales bacterium]